MLVHAETIRYPYSMRLVTEAGEILIPDADSNPIPSVSGNHPVVVAMLADALVKKAEEDAQPEDHASPPSDD